MIRNWAGKVPFLMIFADAISGKILPMLLMVAITLVFIFGIVPVFAPGYIKTLNGFSDIKSKKISKAKAQDVINRNVKTNTVFSTLFTRDLRTMFREPSFFANGPLMLIILPVIMLLSGGISFLMTSKENLASVMNQLQMLFLQMEPAQMLSFKHYATLILAAICIFMGNCTSVAATSFSREGKALYDLKAMPIECDTIVLVKFWHAFMYCLIAVVVISLYFIGAVALLNIPLTVSDIFTMLIEACIISLLVSLVLIFTEMFIDTVNPKLQWENPTAAFKQNVNAVVSSFISMGVVGIFVVLMLFLPKTSLGMLLIALIFAVIAAPLGYFYFKYAVKKIPKM
jgi:ABC-2 type transport system permease protein